MSAVPLAQDRQEAEARLSDAAALYAAALRPGRRYTAHEIQALKRRLDQAEERVRELDG